MTENIFWILSLPHNRVVSLPKALWNSAIVPLLRFDSFYESFPNFKWFYIFISDSKDDQSVTIIIITVVININVNLSLV